ncbi:MAG TPA: preprotein translocase subunit SecE [Acidimicrobiales bacterium]|nr:preprotein translocase subunit SecE [Acidimicrobiales bacterium]
MNRQTKRIMQRQGEVASGGAPLSLRPATEPGDARGGTRAPTPVPGAEHPRLSVRIATYFAEVRAELSKVLWPRREEVRNYASVVLTTLVLLALLIFGLNYAFARGVIWLFK